MSGDTSKAAARETHAARQDAKTPVVDVRDLLAGGREAIIIHAGERYRQRVTAKDKLILTK